MTTEERTQYVIKWRHKLRLPFCINGEHYYFHISPVIVVFQQFTPGVYLSVMVTIRNVTSVIRLEQTRSTFLPNEIIKLRKKKKRYRDT